MYNHNNENNQTSLDFYKENEVKFSKQCETVLGLLKLGKRLTVRNALIDHNIGHLPRRIADLIDKGIDIKKERGEGGTITYSLILHIQ